MLVTALCTRPGDELRRVVSASSRSSAAPGSRQQAKITVIKRFVSPTPPHRSGAALPAISRKIHGPDANGSYGGIQGQGELEAVCEEKIEPYQMVT